MDDNSSTNDLPTLDTKFGTAGFIKRLAKEVRDSPSPKSLSITGYWGSGKTSALAQVCYELTKKEPPGYAPVLPKQKPDRDIVGIWFEAWRYQNEPVPIVALLHCIKNHFSSTDKFIDKAGKLVNVALLGAFSVLDGVIKSVTGMSGLGKIKDIGDKYEKDNLLSRLASDQINDALKKAIDVIINDGKTYRPNKNKKLVIFIDDLDRCEPKAADKLLEGIKLYLSIPNCTVVMAIDQKQIEGVLSKKAKDELGVENDCFYGIEYMEKLCQDAHRMPIPNQLERSTFVIDLVESLIPELISIEGLKKVFNDFDCLPANPRRLKMLANRIASFYRQTADKHEMLFEDSELVFESIKKPVYELALLVVCVFSVSYPNIYERIEISDKFVSDIVDYCDPTGQTACDEKVFAGFIKPNNTATASTLHPSALEVFRLVDIFRDNRGSIGKYKLDATAFGKLMHQLIRAYNQ